MKERREIMDNRKREVERSKPARKTSHSRRNKWLILGVVSTIFLVLFLIIGCTPRTAAPTGNTEEEDNPPVVDVAWSESSDCGTCHVTETKASTDSSYGAYIHFQEGETCLTCHTNTDSKLNKVHEGYATGKVPIRLSETKDSMNESLCLTSGCHVKSDIIEATKASTVLTDNSGRVQNQHDLPDDSDHKAIDCLSCHTMHQPLQLDVTARSVCIGCHHKNEYECHTCHESEDGPE